MYKKLSVYDFINEFQNSSRAKQFSREALFLIYDYEIEIEAVDNENNGSGYEFDLISICCNYVEFKDLTELQKDYNIDTIEELEKKTTVLQGDNCIVIERY